MVRGTVTVASGVDRFAEIQNQLADLAKKEVLVGIPAENKDRRNSDEVNNAALLYLHTYGSPLRQIPARPVLEPAIEDKKEIIGRWLGAAAKAALGGNAAKARDKLMRAGLIGKAAAKRWFDNPKNGWPRNSERTIRAKGSDKPLVDTDQMRKAITHVLRDKE